MGTTPLERDFSVLTQLPQNNQLVIYELPTTWTQSGRNGEWDLTTGSFRVIALLFIDHFPMRVNRRVAEHDRYPTDFDLMIRIMNPAIPFY